MAELAGSRRDAEASAWAVGFTVFAASLMILVGSFHVIVGLAAVFKNEFFAVTPNYLFELDVSTWGWIHLLGGAIVIGAGFGLFGGAVWARSIGVVIAIVSSIVNFAWLPYQPVWSSLIIALDVFVIWALTVHGRDIEQV